MNEKIFNVLDFGAKADGITYDTAVKSTDKAEMVRAFEAAGVEHPWYYVVTNPADVFEVLHKVNYPCIAKPTDNSGSRGIMLAHNPEELLTAVAYSAKNGRGGAVIIEEYLQGPEVSVEIVVHRGVPHVLQITDKLTTGAPRFIEMGHAQPSSLGKEDLDKISDLACRSTQAVGLMDGPAHVEIILTAEGPKMVEMGARMGGGCITTHLVPLSTGIDMVKATIDICLGQEPDLVPTISKGAAIRFFAPPCGIIQSIEHVDEANGLPGIKEIAFTKSVGDRSVPLSSGADRAGYVIAQMDTPSAAVDSCETALKIIHFNITNE